MAPIKFEEHIREKLDEREIQPSAGSWDKLNSRLDASKNRSGKKWWLSAVAAVGVLLIASILFVNQQEQAAIPIVETPGEEKVRANSGTNEVEQPVEVASEIKNESSEDEIIQPVNIKKDTERTDGIAAQNSNINPASEGNEIEEPGHSKRVMIEPVEIKKTAIVENNSGMLYDKVKEVLSEVYLHENTNGNHTVAEVDALLMEATREISQAKKMYNGSVNADALLADVEYEVDQSFRKEVFEFLKEEFLKAKTAVATRND